MSSNIDLYSDRRVIPVIPLQRIKTERSYSLALGEEILEQISKTKNNQLLYREVLELLGDHENIKLKIDELVFNNLILKIPIKIGNVKDFVLTIPRKRDIAWDTMVACPCFTCTHVHECEIGNPVNPVSCQAFNEWLLEEDNTSSIQPFKFVEYDEFEGEDDDEEKETDDEEKEEEKEEVKETA